jgi:hypothetical protein
MDEVNNETQVFRHLIKYTTVYIMINVLQARHTVPFSAYREQQPKSLPHIFLLIEIR